MPTRTIRLAKAIIWPKISVTCKKTAFLAKTMEVIKH